MSLVASDKGGNYEQPSEGMYIARCIRVIDLGTQTTEYMGNKKSKQKVLITWELLGDEGKMGDGRPFAISKRYTRSLHEKSGLCKDLQGWRGRSFTEEEKGGFDLSTIAGKYCNLQVLYARRDQKTYANVASVTFTREQPAGVNPVIVFDIDNPDMEAFNQFGKYVQETIQLAPEWKRHDAQPESQDHPPVEPDPTPPEDFPGISGDQLDAVIAQAATDVPAASQAPEAKPEALSTKRKEEISDDVSALGLNNLGNQWFMKEVSGKPFGTLASLQDSQWLEAEKLAKEKLETGEIDERYLMRTAA